LEEKRRFDGRREEELVALDAPEAREALREALGAGD